MCQLTTLFFIFAMHTITFTITSSTQVNASAIVTPKFVSRADCTPVFVRAISAIRPKVAAQDLVYTLTILATKFVIGTF